ncbi:MAG: hypothetical protein JXR84_12005 [Anaerolineae bacterium]|nr:hypothetical protein [Anaerolineae bacterium]
MKPNKWGMAVLALTLSVLVIYGFLLLTVPRHTLAQAVQAPTQPGVAISPGVTGLIDAGDIVTYYHTITNTGTAQGIFYVSASASEGWEVEFYNVQFPAGTTIILPFTLQAGEVATFVVRLTVPAAVRPGIVNTTAVTATVVETIDPYAHAVAYNTAIAARHVYLPLILMNYKPFYNGNFDHGLNWWSVAGVLGAAPAVDPDQSTNPVALIGNPAFGCTSVPVGYGSLSQSFSVPKAPQGGSMQIQFRYRIYSNDQNVTLGDNTDTFDVLVNDVLRLRDANRGEFNYCNVPPYDLGWKTADIDLGAGGLLVELLFQVHNRPDRLYNTYVLIDDVSIVAVE